MSDEIDQINTIIINKENIKRNLSVNDSFEDHKKLKPIPISQKVENRNKTASQKLNQLKQKKLIVQALKIILISEIV